MNDEQDYDLSCFFGSNLDEFDHDLTSFSVTGMMGIVRAAQCFVEAVMPFGHRPTVDDS